ncbi:MAG: DUF805 domain-containing protein [Alphaproteobacteria bacterium]|nr:DUF805 domain-containing protein [Alphaproteobacteria bacterium]
MNTTKKYKQHFIYPDEALHNFFAKGFVWNDIATRSEYWWAWLLLSVAGVFASIIPILGLLFGLLIYIPWLALTARRWNDLGYNGIKLTMFELLLIPVGFLLFLFIGVLFALTGVGSASGLIAFIALYFIVILIFYIVKTIFFCMPSKIKPAKQQVTTTKHSHYYDDEED